MRRALDFMRADDDRTIEEQVAITEIPSPPFKERVRAEDYRRRLQAAGLADVRIDAEGNVIGLRRGTGKGPTLVVSAHLDTVFPEGTDVKVKRNGERYEAPGIVDDVRGLAAMLSVARSLQDTGLKTLGDIVFVGTVGEEELGDLRGVKALFREHPRIDGFISIDGSAIEQIVQAATGSRRYRIVYTGPGGHSFSAFGAPSATHALGRAVAKIAEVRPPAQPKTTFTVGTVRGGSAVNAIAAEAELGLDMRSNDPAELKKLEEQILALARQAAEEESRRWGPAPDAIKVEFKLVGDRPAGSQAAESPLVQAARHAVQAVGGEPGKIRLETSSTDANTPLSLGVPAVTIGGGGVSGGSHSLKEWWSPVNAWQGPQYALLIALAMVGVEGVSEPLLPVRR